MLEVVVHQLLASLVYKYSNVTLVNVKLFDLEITIK